MSSVVYSGNTNTDSHLLTSSYFLNTLSSQHRVLR